jgi:hypothetical protein
MKMFAGQNDTHTQPPFVAIHTTAKSQQMTIANNQDFCLFRILF